MWLIRDEEELEKWKLDWIGDLDECGIPEEYPCYVEKKVLDWNMQYEYAHFIYRRNLLEMIEHLNDHPG